MPRNVQESSRAASRLIYVGGAQFVTSLMLINCKGNEEMRLKVILEPSDEGGYTVYVPSLPGCISEGETVQESLENIREAIKLYLEPTEDN